MFSSINSRLKNMSSKSSKSPILAFEESEQHDSLMEQIFEEISEVPDKEPVLEIQVDKSYKKKKQSSKNGSPPNKIYDGDIFPALIVRIACPVVIISTNIQK